MFDTTIMMTYGRANVVGLCMLIILLFMSRCLTGVGVSIFFYAVRCFLLRVCGLLGLIGLVLFMLSIVSVSKFSSSSLTRNPLLSSSTSTTHLYLSVTLPNHSQKLKNAKIVSHIR